MIVVVFKVRLVDAKSPLRDAAIRLFVVLKVEQCKLSQKLIILLSQWEGLLQHIHQLPTCPI